MPSHKKVALKSIRSLTFHANELTLARRTSPIPQLTCIGTPCKLFQPEVVQCTNMGDDGTGNVQWKCDTDLPASLRLGKVDVSCEGWSKAGDMNVLQGSCGLEYNLHRTDQRLFSNEPSMPSKLDRWIDRAFSTFFWIFLIVIAYTLIRSLLLRFFPQWAPPPTSTFLPRPGHDHHGGGGGGPGGGGGGGGPGPGPGFTPGPPPPYTKDETFPTQNRSGGSGPGFWTGLLAGGAATYLAANRGQATTQTQQTRPTPGPVYRGNRRFDEDDDRGVGPSNLGEMRRATGFGGSSTR